jgi:hypothetical protein
VNWFLEVRESQILGLLDEFAAPLTFPCGGRFGDSCEPLMNGHQNTPDVACPVSDLECNTP